VEGKTFIGFRGEFAGASDRRAPWDVERGVNNIPAFEATGLR
jgi:hypothetical protein